MMVSVKRCGDRSASSEKQTDSEGLIKRFSEYAKHQAVF
jgi:hypothetical protein